MDFIFLGNSPELLTYEIWGLGSGSENLES